jgi:hypothetical protein
MPFHIGRYALGVCAAALLAGCGGSQAPIGTPGAIGAQLQPCVTTATFLLCDYKLMSKEENPQEKKTSSLKYDRRNTYGENAKASRKNIAKGKQISHQRERRAIAQNLVALSGLPPNEESMMVTEHAAKTTERRLKRLRFKKVADEPLGVVIERKKTKCAQSDTAEPRSSKAG